MTEVLNVRVSRRMRARILRLRSVLARLHPGVPFTAADVVRYAVETLSTEAPRGR